MMGDPKTMSIYEKLLEVRKSVPYLKKETKGHNCNYVKGSQVLGAVREKLDELGLLLRPEIISTTHQEAKYITMRQEEKIETLVKIDMLFTWYNVYKPEEKIECRWASMGQNERDKAIGSALTYAERYFLLKFFMIATDDLDPDAYKEKYAQGDENEADAQQPQPQKPTPQKILSIDDKIPDAILPQELRGRGITFLELGKNASKFTFATKTAGPQNGLYLLKYWASDQKHPAHSLANQVMDVVSQATSPAEGPTTPQQ